MEEQIIPKKPISLDEKVDTLAEKMDSLTDTLTDFMGFVRDNMVTKDDLEEQLKGFATKDDLKNFATKDDIAEVKEDISDLRLEMQAGFRGIDTELADIKASLARLEKKTQEDDDATVTEIVLLKKRVALLEKDLLLLRENTKQVAHNT